MTGLTKWDPSDYYDEATPTQKKRIHKHIAGKHTDECIKYDVNFYGWYCIYQDTFFCPRPFLRGVKDMTGWKN